MSRAFMTAVPPFNPKQIGGCQLWLDGADPAGTGVAPANGATLTSWTDKSGSGNSVTLPSLTYSLNTYTGYSGVVFTSGTASSQLTLTPFECFFASSYSTGPYFPTSYPGLLGQTSVIMYGNYYTLISANVMGPGGGFNNFSSAIFGDYKTDSRNMTVSGAYSSPSSSFTLRVGSGDGYPGNSWLGHIYEVIVFNVALSTAQRKQVEGYLAQKWGLRQQLPQEHPGQKGIIYPTIKTPLATPLVYPSSFVPTQIANCTLWLDGADPAGTGTPPSNGSTVSTWVDKSGGGNNGSGNGSYSSSGSNIVFNNSSYSLPTGTFISGSGSYTIFSIQSTNNPSGIEYFWSFGPITSAQHLSFPHANSPSPYLSWNGNDYSFTYSMTSGRSFIAVNSYNVSSNFKYGYVNGSLDGSMAPAVARNTSTSPNTLGVGPNGYNLNGTLSEILIFSSFLTTTQQQQVEGYLAWKWALQSYLPANHTYKNSAPNISNALGISRPTYVVAVVPTPVTKVVPSSKTVIATGGNTVVTANGYKIHTFTTVGSAANFVLSANPGNNLFQVLVVGGGGGGGSTYCGGGGGAGGAVYNSSFTITIGTYTVTVGGGGNGTSTYLNGGASGTDTSFSSLTGYGGGGGGSDSSGAGGASGKSGGCGGGAGYATGVGTGSQGYNGSVGERINSIAKAGGGGGMGSAGTISGGGNGLSYTVGGVTATYAAGGGGGTSDIAGATLGLGGSSGIGGSGATQSVAATSPSANTGSGGGGGGGGAYPTGTKGADGIVIIAYQYP